MAGIFLFEILHLKFRIYPPEVRQVWKLAVLEPGIYSWLDTGSLLPGDRWKNKIQDTIDKKNYSIIKKNTRLAKQPDVFMKTMRSRWQSFYGNLNSFHFFDNGSSHMSD